MSPCDQKVHRSQSVSQIFFSNSFFLPHHCRRYVKHAQSPNSEGRASASASFASSSQAAECSTSSGASGSSLSEGASCCAGSSNGSNHTGGACGETNGLDDGERKMGGSLSRCSCALKHAQIN